MDSPRHPMLNTDPIEKMLKADPIEPTENTDPIDITQIADPMDRNDRNPPMDKREYELKHDHLLVLNDRLRQSIAQSSTPCIVVGTSIVTISSFKLELIFSLFLFYLRK